MEHSILPAPPFKKNAFDLVVILLSYSIKKDWVY